MTKALSPAEALQLVETESHSRERVDEPVINEKILRALRDKLLHDAATTKYARLEDFDLNSLRGLTLSQALVHFPKLLDIMDDVLAKVSLTVSDAILSDERGEEYTKKETAERGLEFALLLKRFGMWFYRSGQIPKALKAFRGSLEFLGDDTDIYRMMGDIYSGMENFRDALVCYEGAFKFAPENAAIVRKLADVHVRMAEMFVASDQDQAVNHFNKALGYIRNYLPALCGLGEVAFLDKRFDEAHGYFEQALVVDPSNVRALNGFANVYAVYGDDDEAESLFEEALGKGSVYYPALYDFASFSLLQRKNFRRAMEYISRAILLQPSNTDALLLKVEIAMEMKDFDTAERAVEKVLELDPVNKRAFDYFCRLKNGDCFLPEQYPSSFRSVRDDRQSTSRDYLFSLRFRRDPGNESLFEKYVIDVVKDNPGESN